MTEEKNRLKVLSIKKDCVSLQANQVYPDFIDMLKAKQCASFSHNGNLRNSTKQKMENVVQLFLHLWAQTSVIFHFLGFLRTSVGRIWV